MSLSPPSLIPPGWYPDPSGSRQWRVWTGTQWSEMTRPYGENPSTRLAPNLTLLQSLARVRQLGVVSVIGGLGLLVGVLAHWPGTANPAPKIFSSIALGVAVALFFIGSFICAFAVRELRGRWSLDAYLPGLNMFVASALVTSRLGRGRSWRVYAEIVLLGLFAFSLRNDPWLVTGPMIVAYIETSWFGAYIDQLKGPSTIDEVLPS
jgi:hypothetical protein